MNRTAYESELATLADALECLATARDNQAWAYVLQHAGADIERVASRVAGDSDLATDAVQETLLQIRDYAGSFRRGPAENDPDAAARRWILRVAANTTCKLIRTRVRLRTRHRQAAEIAAMPRESTSDDVERSELDAAVRTALAQLPQRQSEAIVLHHVEGLEFTQVASALGCPVGTAKTNVRRGLETLRRSLERAGMALSLTALVGALNDLHAAAITIGAASSAGLVSAQGKASAFVLAKTAGGLAMAAKITMISAAILAAVITPYALTQEQQHAVKVEQTPPIQAEAQPAEGPAQPQAMAENEAKARANLKSGFLPAEIQWQAGAGQDQDGDGIGEFGFLSELTGKRLGTAGYVGIKLMLDEWAASSVHDGYEYAVYLPDGNGGAISEPPGTDTRRGDSPQAIQEQERCFLVIAWPIDQTKGGNCYAMTQNGELCEQSYDGKKPDWNDVVDRIGGGVKWSVFRETARTKWLLIVSSDRSTNGSQMRDYLSYLANLHEIWGVWSDITSETAEWAMLTNSGLIGPNGKKSDLTLFFYCRPFGHLSPRQPLLIENPDCNSDGGCHVGFIDVDTKHPTSSDASRLQTMYPTYYAYVKAPEARRLWETAIRLADSPKAHDQGLTLDDWAEVSDILDAIAKPVEQWPTQ